MVNPKTPEEWKKAFDKWLKSKPPRQWEAHNQCPRCKGTGYMESPCDDCEGSGIDYS